MAQEKMEANQHLTDAGKILALFTDENISEETLFGTIKERALGERHHDANGGDASLSAQASGHTMKTKVKYYQNEVDWEAVHRSYQENHPAFVEGW